MKLVEYVTFYVHGEGINYIAAIEICVVSSPVENM